jgi:hypothetical protein
VQTEAALIASQINNAIRFAFVQAGFRIKQVGVKFRSDGKILTAMGWHKDGTPFAYASQPFHDDPIQFAHRAAAGLIAAHAGEVPQSSSPVAAQRSSRMANPTGLVERIRALRGQREDRLTQIEQDNERMVAEAAVRQDAALDKLAAKLESDANADKAEITALEDEINRLTNGAP